jgi:hypothetical protein
VAGAQGGDVDLGALGSININTRFFDAAQLFNYLIDNLKFSIGHSYLFGRNAALLGAEWGFPVGHGTMAALFVTGSLGERDDDAVIGAAIQRKSGFNRRPKRAYCGEVGSGASGAARLAAAGRPAPSPRRPPLCDSTKSAMRGAISARKREPLNTP